MNSLHFTKTEWAAALARGVRQCVVIGSRPLFCPDFGSTAGQTVQLFAVAEEEPSEPAAIFVPTRFSSEGLAAALENSEFDKSKASLFVWLGGAGYRTLNAAVASLSFISSLPEGSGVVLDYAVERTSLSSRAFTALDALASRLSVADTVRYLIQPQAVTAMLRGVGFKKILDVEQEEYAGTCGRLISATL